MIYERVGLGELKPTKMVLQLIDRFTRLPRGMVEEVINKVGKFICPIDFAILEAKMIISPEDEILGIFD